MPLQQFNGAPTIDHATNTATVSLTLTGNTAANVIVYAVPATGGAPVAISNPFLVSQGSGNNTQTLNVTITGLNLGTLPPGQYTFYVEGTQQTGRSPIDSASTIQEFVCFAEGTRIATKRGEVPVEALRIGDMIVTVGPGTARLQPTIWLGRMTVDIARQPDRTDAAPVLIRAGALGDGRPHRDLRVSPEHALFLDGHLVPARLLVNGITILQEFWRPRVTYWHVELPAHGVLLAEGAAAESYLDTGNRHLFDPTGVVLPFGRIAHAASDRPRACAPMLDHGPGLERLRDRIASRATRVMIEQLGLAVGA